MKRLLTILVLFGLLIILMIAGRSVLQRKIDSVLSQQLPALNLSPTPSPTHVPIGDITHELFVPYWGLQSSSTSFDPYQKLIYFGVAASTNGLNKEDQGYISLPQFISLAEGKEKILTVRMIDSETNLDVLESKPAQQRIIEQSVQLANNNGFSGIILNLELSALPFESLVEKITEFNKAFYTASKKSGLTYGVTAYGDTFFRVRPFDIKQLSRAADEIYIMTYDFHKAKGNPGPNFPLSGADTYGYDLGKMIDTFLTQTSAEKLTVIFGFYGYDWQVNEKNVSEELAEPVTLKEAESQFIKSCSYVSCEWRRDQPAGEIEVKYVDDNKKQHVVWFEDKESVKRKEQFLKQRGITNFSYWAHSYF